MFRVGEAHQFQLLEIGPRQSPHFRQRRRIQLLYRLQVPRAQLLVRIRCNGRGKRFINSVRHFHAGHIAFHIPVRCHGNAGSAGDEHCRENPRAFAIHNCLLDVIAMGGAAARASGVPPPRMRTGELIKQFDFFSRCFGDDMPTDETIVTPPLPIDQRLFRLPEKTFAVKRLQWILLPRFLVVGKLRAPRDATNRLRKAELPKRLPSPDGRIEFEVRRPGSWRRAG